MAIVPIVSSRMVVVTTIATTKIVVLVVIAGSSMSFGSDAIIFIDGTSRSDTDTDTYTTLTIGDVIMVRRWIIVRACGRVGVRWIWLVVAPTRPLKFRVACGNGAVGVVISFVVVVYIVLSLAVASSGAFGSVAFRT